MALLFIDSFDHYETADILGKWTQISAGGPEIVAGAGRCGTKGLRMGAIGGLLKGLPFGTTAGVFGFAYRPGTQINEAVVFAAIAGSAAEHFHINRHLDGSVSCSRYNVVIGGEFMAQSAPGLVNIGSYYYIELIFTIHPTAGSLVVRLNGAPIITFAGATEGTGAGAMPTAIVFQSSGNTVWDFDDVYALDGVGAAPLNGPLGDVRVEYLRPNGAGISQEWDLVGAIAHWIAVDDADAPDDDVSYITTTIQGRVDTQAYVGTGLPSGAIYGLQTNLYARKTDSGARSIAPVVRHAGVLYVGQNVQPSFTTNYLYHLEIFSVNPATGLAWTIAAVNALEVGAMVTV
jgi:hypothetical protein